MNPRMRSINPFIRSMYHGIRSMSITAVISIHVRKASRSHIWLSAHSSTLSAQTFSQPLNEPSQPLYQSIYPLYVSPQPLNKPPYPLNPHQSKHPPTTPINLANQTKPNQTKSNQKKPSRSISAWSCPTYKITSELLQSCALSCFSQDLRAKIELLPRCVEFVRQLVHMLCCNNRVALP